jgi:hypothetical protein
MSTETLIAERAIKSKTVAVDFDPFAGPRLAHIVPITAPQAEIWLACLLGGDDASRAYNESISLSFSGLLDKTALQNAFQQVVDRHESLRSAFSADGKHMCIFEHIFIDITYQDISKNNYETRKNIINEYVKNDAHHVFDLIKGPLVKASLIKVEDQAHHFILTAHHIICDGWSTGILLQDLGKIYSALAQNIFPILPLPVQFSQYAHEHQAFEASEDHFRIEQFWVKQYASQIPALELPIDFQRPAIRTFKSSRLDFPLNNELVIKLKKVGMKAGCSFVTTLMTCFEIMLHRLTNQETVVVGLPTAGQSATGNHYLIGHCVNLLPLKSSINLQESFLNTLLQRKAYLFDAYENQQVTFGSLLQKIKISRDTSRTPLAAVMFNIDMGMAEDVNFHNLSFKLQSNPRAFENFELFLNASGIEEQLSLEWSYSTDLFI